MSAVGTTADALVEQDVRLVRTPAPAAIVIFGATGDLTQRKLLPALYSLATQQLLAPETAIVGVARSEMSDDEFRGRMRAGVEAHARVPLDEGIWDGFARRLSYVSATFDDAEAYGRLRAHLDELDAERRTRGNRLFYLATAPEFFPVIAENLGGAGLAEEPDDGERFARLVVEKPFGMDLESARELNARLNTVFRERQVYRIDHYLGKETVQNILVLRFGNAIFEPLWNRQLRRPRADHGGRGPGRRVPRRLLRPVGGAARHRPEPHAAGPVARRDGAARALRGRRGARREGEGAARDPALRRRDGAPRRRARPVRPRLDRRRARAGLSRGGRRRRELHDRDLRRDAGWRSTTGAGPACPSTCAPASACRAASTEVAIQFKPAPHLPFAVDGGRDASSRTCCCCASSPTRGPRLRFLAKVPGPADRPPGREHGLRLRQLVPAPLPGGLRAPAARRPAAATPRCSRGGTRWSAPGRSSIP